MNQMQIRVGDTTLVLQGAGKSPLLRGCLRRPAGDVNQNECHEELDLILEGSSSETNTFLSNLQSLFSQLDAGVPGLLVIQPNADAPLYESPLLAGCFTWLVGSVQPKGIGLRLALTRLNYWELPWQDLPLSNAYGKDQSTPLLVYNRLDASGENYVTAAADAFVGDLPAPLRLYLVNDQGISSDLCHLYGGMALGENALPALEGEDAESDPSLGVVIDPGSMGGAYAFIDWQGDSPVCLLTWTLPAVDWAALAGKTIFPLARMKNTAPDDVWVWWKLYQGGLVDQSAQQLLENDRWLLPLPRFTLPELPDGLSASGNLRLELWGQCLNSGSHPLSLDAVQLFGTAGLLDLSLLPEGSYLSGETLLIDPGHPYGYCQTASDAAQRIAYQVDGRGFWLIPNQAAVFHFAWEDENGCIAAQALRVQIQVRPRVRVLP